MWCELVCELYLCIWRRTWLGGRLFSCLAPRYPPGLLWLSSLGCCCSPQAVVLLSVDKHTEGLQTTNKQTRNTQKTEFRPQRLGSPFAARASSGINRSPSCKHCHVAHETMVLFLFSPRGVSRTCVSMSVFWCMCACRPLRLCALVHMPVLCRCECFGMVCVCCCVCVCVSVCVW